MTGTNSVFQLFGLLMALVGLFAALRPEPWSKCFLAGWQRARMTPEAWNFVPIVGWLVFGVGVLFVLVPLIDVRVP